VKAAAEALDIVLGCPIAFMNGLLKPGKDVCHSTDVCLGGKAGESLPKATKIPEPPVRMVIWISES
jgi:hypothetical protein